MHDDRVHARMALVRDLFGLEAAEAKLEATEPEIDAEPEQELAEVRELPQRQARARRQT
jgi:hypothetical protein